MSFDATTLFLGLITGGIGMVLFVYGKKQERWPHLVAGLLYMAYPYFVGSATGIIGVGIALGVGLWFAVRQGY
jgi:4-hydroxybenzoate polyprenyltransferase